MQENTQKTFIRDFEEKIYEQKKKKDFNEIIFLCVGTDKVVGDSVGPLVGSKLKEYFYKFNYLNVDVYGSLENNVNYINVSKVLEKIKDKYKNSCIVVIDSALSNKQNIGEIFVNNKATLLGKGLNKNKLEIGDISIKAVVGKNFRVARYNFMNLSKVSLGLVMDISDKVANGIFEVIKFV